MRPATVGISNGHDVFTQAYTLATYSNAAVRLDPPFNAPTFPNGSVDSPTEGSHVQGVMTVTGVAWDPGAVISRVHILIDRMEQARGTLGLTRTDFCSTQNMAGCPRVSYSAPIDLAGRGVTPGTHLLTVRVTNSRGAWLDYPDQPCPSRWTPARQDPPAGKWKTLPTAIPSRVRSPSLVIRPGTISESFRWILS
jgi:hypothetical protein